jgi:hypothetical protein
MAMDATALLEGWEAPRSAEALERKAWVLASERTGSRWPPDWLVALELRALTDPELET